MDIQFSLVCFLLAEWLPDSGRHSLTPLSIIPRTEDFEHLAVPVPRSAVAQADRKPEVYGAGYGQVVILLSRLAPYASHTEYTSPILLFVKLSANCLKDAEAHPISR